jgi:hypothetical protein
MTQQIPCVPAVVVEEPRRIQLNRRRGNVEGTCCSICRAVFMHHERQAFRLHKATHAPDVGGRVAGGDQAGLFS